MSSRIFIDGYQHYTENSIKCRRLAGTADEPARTTHIYRSVACARRQHMRTRYTTHARQRQARATTTRHWPAAPGAPRHAPLAIPRRPLGQPRAKRALPALRPAALAPRQLQREEGGMSRSEAATAPPLPAAPPPARPRPSSRSKVLSCVQGHVNPGQTLSVQGQESGVREGQG